MAIEEINPRGWDLKDANARQKGNGQQRPTQMKQWMRQMPIVAH
jgi:hypothetical protein